LLNSIRDDFYGLLPMPMEDTRRLLLHVFSVETWEAVAALTGEELYSRMPFWRQALTDIHAERAASQPSGAQSSESEDKPLILREIGTLLRTIKSAKGRANACQGIFSCTAQEMTDQPFDVLAQGLGRLRTLIEQGHDWVHGDLKAPEAAHAESTRREVFGEALPIRTASPVTGTTAEEARGASAEWRAIFTDLLGAMNTAGLDHGSALQYIRDDYKTDDIGTLTPAELKRCIRLIETPPGQGGLPQAVRDRLTVPPPQDELSLETEEA
jgi:hypothetical protein